ncbi:hypothetical protein BGW36DRAFT_411698 [Talaromyces proteolyticus]|uniref:Uncharacterized protein n=1 Tax=Talaromyces proteolyticus TaxID=1131652 RepID=A0AAD4KFT1_9EURO|nr:uncharacterized protein BGW36DRAFT_411698 [Talaromyces proteolyticus]KAH8690960.1 hypothetical protein BGW36DRAFT_411698 [Talaromyces proteolyticus]
MGHPGNIEANTSRTSARRSRKGLLFILFAALFIYVVGALLLFYTDVSYFVLVVSPFLWDIKPAPFHAFSANNITYFEKPSGVKIFGIVGYRNPNRTGILNCYLQRNLAQNGGLLDEVIFIPETTEESHLQWLETIAKQSDSYSIRTSDDVIYSSNDLYIKIDGDVLYIEDDAIPSVVNTKMEHPESLIVSGNIIHQPAVANFHLRPGVINPNFKETGFQQAKQHWLSSILSYWHDPHSPKDQTDIQIPIKDKYHFPTLGNILDTERYNWVAQQARQHYSFLEHLEQGTLERYKFPEWKNPRKDISGSLVCIKGSDMRKVAVKRQTSSWLRKHTVIDGKRVVSHYSNEAGLQGLDSTDVMERYQRYAKENICPEVIGFI